MWALPFELLYGPQLGVIWYERGVGGPQGGPEGMEDASGREGTVGLGGRAGMKEGSDFPEAPAYPGQADRSGKSLTSSGPRP